MNERPRNNAADQKQLRIMRALRVISYALALLCIFFSLAHNASEADSFLRTLPYYPIRFLLCGLLLVSGLASTRSGTLCTCTNCKGKIAAKTFLNADPETFRCPHCGEPYCCDVKPLSLD